jgi:hypothetical protein
MPEGSIGVDRTGWYFRALDVQGTEKIGTGIVFVENPSSLWFRSRQVCRVFLVLTFQTTNK